MQLHGLWKWTFWVFEWMSIIEFLHIHGNMITAGQSYYVCWRWPLTMSTCWSNLSKPCFAGIHGFGNWWMSAEFPSWMLFPWDVFSPVSAFCSRMPLRFTKELGGWFTMVATALNDMSCFRTPPAVSKLCQGRLQGWKAHMNKGSKPCKSYKGKDGRRRFHGTKNLKATEKLISWNWTGICWGLGGWWLNLQHNPKDELI